MQGFKSFPERLKELDDWMANIGTPVMFGNPFLDDALGGIWPDDLIIMSAKTGGGKTQFVTNVAYNAAKQGKKVHFIALEAHRGEIESRLKFKALAQAFFTQINYRDYKERPDYQEWIQGKQHQLLGKFEPEIREMLSQTLATLHTFYTDRDFNADNFDVLMGAIGDETDLIIVDHLHYFDIDGRDQNLEFKKTVKQIRNTVQFYRKPVIMLVQLRKGDRASAKLLPEIDDIHGSSDIAKIATKIIVTAPARDVETDMRHLFPTYFQIIKNRTSSERTYYTAQCVYNLRTNDYKPKYELGVLKDNGTNFVMIDRMEYPQWAKPSTLEIV
jgi:hypothetical protein